MFKKIFITLAFLAITPQTFANSLDTSSPDTSFYIETPMAAKLTLFDRDASGKMAVSSQVTVPEKSILAVNLSTFSVKVNDEWICGIRIVDVMDEELRESDIFDETNFCIRTADVKKAGFLDSSNGLNKEAFLKYQKTGEVAELHELGFAAKNQQQQNAEYLQTFTSTAPAMVSPLKNCGLGCVHVTSEYGMRLHPVHKKKRLHKGIDLRARVGEQVVSVFDGKVLATRTERDAQSKKMVGYGHYVIVIHPQRQIETLYAHLSAFKTAAGEIVEQGKTIALSGNSGVGTASHLHFEIHTRKNDIYTPVNPRTYISKLLNVNL